MRAGAGRTGIATARLLLEQNGLLKRLRELMRGLDYKDIDVLKEFINANGKIDVRSLPDPAAPGSDS